MYLILQSWAKLVKFKKNAVVYKCTLPTNLSHMASAYLTQPMTTTRVKFGVIADFFGKEIL